MANGFGSLWVGASGIQTSSNALNTTANNLSNVNTAGYVREQVVQENRNYVKYGEASISSMKYGLGVEIGTIAHVRDIFLDKSYRTATGRYSFYSTCAEATAEVETFLQETEGQAFKNALKEFYTAIAELAKEPGSTTNQDLVLERTSLFLSRASAVEKGLEDYQLIINQKINEKTNKINEIGDEILKYNKQIMAIEAGGIEQAMDLRDKRDKLIDDLSELCKFEYNEDYKGNVHIQIEGMEFVDEAHVKYLGARVDKLTGFSTPYWVDLSDPEKDEYRDVFRLDNISADNANDIGSLKALLLSRGDHKSSYLEFLGLDSESYNSGIGNSVMLNSEAELDTLIHEIATKLNDIFSPVDDSAKVYGSTAGEYSKITGKTLSGIADTDNIHFEYMDIEGNLHTDFRVCDIYNADVGADGKLPPRELFTRNGTPRYTEQQVFLKKDDGSNVLGEDGQPVSITMYVYNEEMVKYRDANEQTHLVKASDYEFKEGDVILDTSQCYSLKNLSVNPDLTKQSNLLPYMSYWDQTQIDYDLGKAIEKVWSGQSFNLNPSDKTPSNFNEFYTKWVGELGTTGSVYNSTAKAMSDSQEQIEGERQGVIGVSSDEELTAMIKYQSAYNAASRYINVVSEMIEHIITSLGH